MNCKKNKHIRFFIKTFIFILFMSPSFIFPSKNTEIGRKAVESFGKKIRKEKGWILSGSGGSFYRPEKIILNMSFEVCGKYTLTESRKLIIETTENFIEFVNRDKRYLKIFKDSKFSKTNIELSISFHREKNTSNKKDNYIDYVFLQNEILTYCYESEDGYRLDSNDKEDETYEQARAIVMQEEKSKENE